MINASVDFDATTKGVIIKRGFSSQVNPFRYASLVPIWFIIDVTLVPPSLPLPAPHSWTIGRPAMPSLMMYLLSLHKKIFVKALYHQ
jgi:hypothetical protein